MDHANNYYEKILRPYQTPSHPNLFISKDITASDAATLKATERHTDSLTGIVIIPGITVPRESCYRLFAHFQNHNVLTYDLRGQADSGGVLDWEKCMADINAIGRDFKKRRKLRHLIGIGHSFGGLTLLRSSLEPEHPYDLRIALAAPLEMKSIAGRIPEKRTALLLYAHNLHRAFLNPALRDPIVRKHQSYLITSFFKKPSIVALRIDQPEAFNRLRETTPKLTDFIGDITLPTDLIYAGQDQRLGPVNSEAYEDLQRLASAKGIGFKILERLSHRFNTLPERRFMLSYNNEALMEQMDAILMKHPQFSINNPITNKPVVGESAA
jgi:alpha-beta hydrolase superfamily lysophospholipase